MNLKLILLCLAALPLLVAARTLSPQEALSRATASTMAKAPSKVAYEVATPAFTATVQGTPSLYVLNSTSGSGFIILSADDAAVPVLGYSDSGSFDATNIPDNLKSWLSFYADEISAASTQGVSASPLKAPSRLANVEPLVKTKWNQSAPFNDRCPLISDTRAVTGCVATAMAQIMNYYQWPVTGTGSYSYTDTSLGEISMDFSTVTFDWANMSNTYSVASNDVNKDAVATLMYACGVSVNMAYGLGASSASNHSVWGALIENFNYDKGMRYLSRDYFSNREWNDMIYNELVAGRPVLYDGQSSTGGHAFVCDGYSDGYFHINWGWGGLSDGYFLLSALDPDSQGIGGSTNGYNSNQSALIGIQKPVPGSVEATAVGVAGIMVPEKYSYGRFEPIYLTFKSNYVNNPGFFNLGYKALEPNLGVKLVNADGIVSYADNFLPLDIMAPNSGYNMLCTAFEVDNGTYAVTPAYKDANGVWHDMLENYNEKKLLTVDITETAVNFTLHEIPRNIEVTDFTLLTPLYSGRKVKAHVRAKCDADYSVKARLCMFEPGSTTPVLWGADMLLAFEAGKAIDIDYVSAINIKYKTSPSPALGDYELQLVDDRFNPLSGRIPVTYAASPGGATLAINSLEVVNADKNAVPSNDIRLKAKVTCAAGYMDSPLSIYLFDMSTLRSVTAFSTPTLFLAASESQEFELTASYTQGTVGNKYSVQFLVGSTLAGPDDSFTMAAPIVPAAEPNVLTFNHKGTLSASTPVNTVVGEGGAWTARAVELVDAVQFYNPVELTAQTLTYTRTFTHTGWAGLYVPFELTAAEWSEYASRVIMYTGDTEVDGETVLTFETVADGATLAANQPYLFCPIAVGEKVLTLTDKTLYATPYDNACFTPVGAKYSIYGLYEIKDDMADDHAYALKDGNFYPTNNNSVLLRPFRIYLKAVDEGVHHAPARIKMVVDYDVDGIDGIIADPDADYQLYDLNGRRVDNPTTGIYILNGQKILIK